MLRILGLNGPKWLAGLSAAGVLAFGAGAAAPASAQSVTAFFTVYNNGSALTLDSARCSPEAAVSAPPAIAANGRAEFNVTGPGRSILCSVRYKAGADGCQFQVEATASRGYASANGYAGDTTPPTCKTLQQQTVPAGFAATFMMAH